ncbi:MAG: type VI secretion system membrane subunit TssM [Gammaproteobacteria bacterium]
MLALLKNRAVLVALGLVLVALLIWFAGPYIAFADYKPLQGAVARLVFILLMVIAYAAFVQLRQLRNANASRQLVDEVSKQSDSDPSTSRLAAADTAQLRKRFEEAINTLKKSRRKGLTSLYELPWYIIIGPPGSGKTTALVNSGLNFPLAQKFGREALRGVGGTRNCDWWFTDEAILLDTAGRYTTQDSDSRVDAAGWAAFLQLLVKYRRRRPINGVIVAMSASDLLTLNERDAERHAIAIRQRLDELSRNVRIDVPVYFLVTKADLVAGFSEFFDELGQEGRAQVWGSTFPIELTESGRAAESFGQEFDQLIERLQQRVLFRVEGERDPRRRIGAVAFPRQMAALKPLLDGLLKRVFSVSDFDHRFLLRGVYFTSGTQEGTPIDRMLGAVARTFGFTSAVATPPTGPGKAYFIERLLRNVIFQESGLAGANRKAEVQRVVLQSAAYVGCVVVLVLGIIALGVSYRANANYVEDVGVTVKALSGTEVGAGALSAEFALDRLDSLRAVAAAAEKHKGDVPWRMRSGLYRGNSLGSAARDAYTRELNGVLPIVLSTRFAQQLRANAGSPDPLYEYLKGYLMLGEDEHRDGQYLRALGRVEWQRMLPEDTATARRLGDHFDQLLEEKGRLRSVSVDAELVEQARATLRSASLAQLMYSRLKLSSLVDTGKAVRLDLAAGPGAPLIFVRRSGKPLTEPIPALYTRAAFDEFNSAGKLTLVRQFAEDAWVFGAGPLDVVRSGALVHDVLEVYEQDYIRTWDAVLRDITLKPTLNPQQLADVLAVAAGPESPFKGLLVAVAKNTDLLAPKPASPGQLAQNAVAGRTTQLQQLLGGKTSNEAAPGSRVSLHFAPIRELVGGGTGAPAPIDGVLASLGETQRRLQSIGSGLGETSALDAISRSGEVDALKSLQVAARQLPVPVGDMISQIGLRTETAAVSEARGDLSRRYSQQVLRECRELVEGRYPLSRNSSNDVPLGDFGHVFGPGGVFDKFFNENLAPLVDTSRTPWRFKAGTAPIGSGSLLRQFQLVQRIRDAYFGGGGQTPEARFFLVPDELDASATRFSLEVDGQGFEYRHGPQQSRAMSWPGTGASASFSFEERGAAIPGVSKQGPWAWFRLLEQARLEPENSSRYRITFTAGGRSMRVVLNAASARNPFGLNALAGFSCAM